MQPEADNRSPVANEPNGISLVWSREFRVPRVRAAQCSSGAAIGKAFATKRAVRLWRGPLRLWAADPNPLVPEIEVGDTTRGCPNPGMSA